MMVSLSSSRRSCGISGLIQATLLSMILSVYYSDSFALNSILPWYKGCKIRNSRGTQSHNNPAGLQFTAKTLSSSLRSSSIVDSYDASLPPPIVIEQVPTKIMLFIDGTWLYYSMIQGRDSHCPVRERFGENWQRDYKVDWAKIPQIIASNLNGQLFRMHNTPRLLEVVKTSVFTSTRADTAQESPRTRMIQELHRANFEVHRLVTAGLQEKCVDISLAVDMLYMATVPYAYDIAVIVTGDKDFIPAMEKTRLKGKRVAVCSMRNSCNRDLSRPDQHSRDFDVIWLDDCLDSLVVSREEDQLYDVLVDEVRELIMKGETNSRSLGRSLQSRTVKIDSMGETPQNALSLLKQKFISLRTFLEMNDDIFVVNNDANSYPEFSVSLAETTSSSSEESMPLEDSSSSDDAASALGRIALGRGETEDLYLDDDDDDEEDDGSKEGNIQRKRKSSNVGVDATDFDVSLSSQSVAKLKDMLRDRGLKVSGSKIELIERLLSFEKINSDSTRAVSEKIHPKEIAATNRRAAAESTVVANSREESGEYSDGTFSPAVRSPLIHQSKARVKERSSRDGFSSRSSSSSSSSSAEGGAIDEDLGERVVDLVRRYIQDSAQSTISGDSIKDDSSEILSDSDGKVDNVVTSRDLGRFLQSYKLPLDVSNSNSSEDSDGSSGESALTLLKSKYGSLKSFLICFSKEFRLVYHTISWTGEKDKVYGVALRKKM